jgi:hypothetical protein
MKQRKGYFRQALLPGGVLLAVLCIHFVWLGVFPETNSVQDRWVTAGPNPQGSWLIRYIENQSYFLGYSYALCLSFASVALRRYWQERACEARNLAIGSTTLSGFLAVAGCFLLGCCGSPMLVVYLNLFGAKFLPLARPLVAILTTLTICAAWWWMNRYGRLSRAMDIGGDSNKCNHNDYTRTITND